MERQVLKYFDTLHGPHVFPIRSLASSTISEWTYPGPTRRVNFQSRSFTPFSQPLLRLNNLCTWYLQIQTFLQLIQFSMAPRRYSNHHQRQTSCCRTPLADLRPSTSGNHWRLIFVVPDTVAATFRLQDFEGECEWARKVDQYVLGINEDIL